jgi:hypothetical protein
MKNIKHLFVGLFIFTLCATICANCTNINKQRYKVSRGTIYNSSRQEIHDVRVVHEPTNVVVATNSILPDRSFDLGFEEQMLMANYAVFTWTDDVGNRHEQMVHLPRPLQKEEEMHCLIYTVDQRCKVSVHLAPLD